MQSIIYTRKVTLQQLTYYICMCILKKQKKAGIMASNTNIAVLPGGIMCSVIISDQPIDVLLISFLSF